MSQERYHVVFRGEIQEGKAVDEVKQRLMSMFGLPRERLEQVFAGQPLMVKEQVSYEEALKYKTAFEGAGTVCRMEPVQAHKQPAPPQTHSQKASAQEERYHVIFSGNIAAGSDPEQVKRHLAKLFKTNRAQIDKLFTGKPARIRENVPHQSALHCQKVLERGGAICSIQAVEQHPSPKHPEPSKPATPQRPSTAPKNKRADSKPAPGADIPAILNHYRSRIQKRDVLRLAPRIPTETMVLANKTYAYAFNRHSEKTFAALDLTALGYGLLLTDKRLYLYEKPHKPLTFKLDNLQSVEIRNDQLHINEREVMTIPPEIREDMPVLVNLIRDVASVCAQQAAKNEERSSASVHADEQASASAGGKKWAWAVVGMLLVFAIGVAAYVQLRGPSLPQEGVIKTLVKDFVRDDRITLNLVSIGQMGEFDADQHSVPIQVSVSGQCEDRVLLKDLNLELAANDDGEWAIASPQHFAFEYLLCPFPEEKISAIIDAEMEKELQHVRRAYTKQNKELLVPLNALLLEIGVKAPRLKQITIKYRDIYSQKIEGVETDFVYQNFDDMEILLSRNQAREWTIGGMDALKKLDEAIKASIKSMEEYAKSLQR